MADPLTREITGMEEKNGHGAGAGWVTEENGSLLCASKGRVLRRREAAIEGRGTFEKRKESTSLGDNEGEERVTPLRKGDLGGKKGARYLTVKNWQEKKEHARRLNSVSPGDRDQTDPRKKEKREKPEHLHCQIEQHVRGEGGAPSTSDQPRRQQGEPTWKEENVEDPAKGEKILESQSKKKESRKVPSP